MGTNTSCISDLPQVETLPAILRAHIVLTQPEPMYFFKAFFLTVLASGYISK